MAGVVFDKREWDHLFKKIGDNASKGNRIIKTVFNTIGFRDVIQHFQKERGPKAPWKRSTRAKKQGGRTLQDTGNLRKNFLPGNVRDEGANKVVFFNPTSYASVHDDGAPGKNIPQREFMYLTERAQRRMAKAFSELMKK